MISNGIEADDLHSALQRMLQQTTSPETIDIIRSLPPTLAFKVDRIPSATPKAESKTNERQLFKILPEIYLDRYLAINRRAYVEGRQRMSEIEGLITEVRAKRYSLAAVRVRSSVLRRFIALTHSCHAGTEKGWRRRRCGASDCESDRIFRNRRDGRSFATSAAGGFDEKMATGLR